MQYQIFKQARRIALALTAAVVVTAQAAAGPLEDLQPGHWYEVPNSQVRSLDPCPARPCSWSGVEGQAGVMDDWNGGALATGYGSKGGLIVWGGGHRGYYGNEVYVFDVGALRWVRLTDPVADPICDDREGYTGIIEGELQDGSPCSPHSYDYIDYHPNTNSFTKLTSRSNHDRGGYGSTRVHLLDLDTKQWRRGARKPNLSRQIASAYDPNRDVFWLMSQGDFAKYDPNANGGEGAWTEYQNINVNIDMVGNIDPVRDLFVAVGGYDNFSVLVFDLKSPSTSPVRVSTAGDLSVQNRQGPAIDWDPTSQAFIGWRGTGTAVHKLTPPSGDWRTGTWQWSVLPAAASNTVTPSSENQQHTYGRWRYVPSVNAFVVVNRTSDNVYFYKLSDAAPIVLPNITFTADATSLLSGGSTTLRWSAANADSCTAGNAWAGTKATSGTQAIGPLATAATYSLTCSNSGGGTATRNVAVSISSTSPPAAPVPVVTLTASPTSVAAGGQSRLTWTSTNATACTASAGDSSWPGTKTVNNSQTVGPINATTTYSLTCTGTGGSGSATATVFVGGSTQPTVTLTATPTSIDVGGSTDLTWSTVNATSCAASGSWTGTVATSGTRRIENLASTQIYTLTCTGASGSASQQVTVTVGSTPPPVAIGTQPQESDSGAGSTGLWQVILLGLLLSLSRLRMLSGKVLFVQGWRLMRAAAFSTFLGLFALTASAAVDATSVTVVSTSGSAQNNVPVTFGQVFKVGEVPAGSTVIASRVATGTSVPIQVDAKAAHGDGSLRHAVITLNVPSLGANAVDQIMLSSAASGGGSGSAVTLQQLLATSFDADISLNVSGTTYSASARTLLQGSTPTSWLNGPLVSEWIVGGPVRTSGGTAHAHLTAYFHVRAYSNGAGGVGTVRVDCIVENGWTLVSGPADFAYTPTISVGGSTAYTTAQLTHYHHTRWHKQFWWSSTPAVYVKLDTAYLQATKAVPNYGSMSYTNDYLNGLMQTATPMSNGDLTRNFPDTGAQAQIGPLPRWDAVYLTSNADVRAFRNVLANNDSAGSYAVHYRDEAAGRGWPVSIGDRSTLSLQTSGALPSIGSDANPNVEDTAHQPSLGFLAYLITGDHYYMEEMHFWTSWNQIWLNASYRQGNKGIVHSQNRTQAWVLRSLGQAAYLTPDAHPYKAHLVASVGHNMAHFDSNYTNNSGANALGIISSYDGFGKLSMWQDDFFTWTVAYLVDLGFESARPLRDWKFKFPISRLDTTDYCFKNAATYQVQTGTSDSAFYPTIKAFYDANIALGFLSAQSSCNAGESIVAGYPAAKDGYVANMTPAVAAAVEAGYPGASAGWARLKGSPVQPDFNDTAHGGASPSPVWNVAPRSNPGSTAPSVSLTVNPSTVSSGGSATLTWSSINSTSCAATGGWSGSKALNGSEPMSNITQTTSYTLSCSGSGGPAAQRTVTVTVGSPATAPAATFSASHASVETGGSTTLTWSSSNATGCSASGDWSGSKAASGSEQVTNLSATSTFTLVCTGAGGSTQPQSVQVAVTAAPAPTPPPSSPGSSSDEGEGGGGALAIHWLIGLIGLAYRASRRRLTR